MDNLKLLKLHITDKLEELENLKSAKLSYDAFENPAKLLKHYKDELRFFEEGKNSLSRMIDRAKDKEELAIYAELRNFYLNAYPELELNLLRIIGKLEEKIKS